MERTTARLALAGFALLNIVLFIGVLLQTGGHFIYSLDDAYIHLAMAENLPGFLGVNSPAEGPTMASSSILYPWLLRPLTGTPLAFLAPYIVNVLGGVLAMLALVRLERQINFFPTATAMQRALLVLGFAALTNLFTLIFTGMEHTWHYALTLVAFSGLLDVARGEKPSRQLWLALIIAPLFRYEALGFSLLGILYLARWWRMALVALGATLAGPVGFGYYLHTLGLPVLPSSVLAKSAAFAMTVQGSPAMQAFSTVLVNMAGNLGLATGWAHLMELGLLTFLLIKSPLPNRQRALGVMVVLTGLAHFMLSRFGWFDRYHAYSLALNLLAIAYFGQPFWQALAKRMKNGYFLMSLMFLAAGLSSLSCMVQTPAAARQIYISYGTLHEFVAHYWQDKVAAYDIGLLAWQNPNAVLDLYGLGSEKMRVLIQHPAAMFVVPAYMKENHYDLLIARDGAQTMFPMAGWVEVAVIHTDTRWIVSALHPHIYAANPARAEEIRTKLKAFEPHMPKGATLQLVGGP